MKNIGLYSVALAGLLSAKAAYGQSDLIENIAVTAVASGSSHDRLHPARKVIDGQVGGDSYWETKKSWGAWESDEGPRGQWLELRWPELKVIGSIQLYSGHAPSSAPVRQFQFEYFGEDRAWHLIPGTATAHNGSAAVRLVLQQPVRSKRLRIVSKDFPNVRINEVMVFPPVVFGDAPPLVFDREGHKKPLTTRIVATPDTGRHYVLVNQAGYTLGWPMRFTAPLSPDGSRFTLTEASTGRMVYSGRIKDHIGDFSGFVPEGGGHSYRIGVSGQGKAEGVSFDFRIAPMYFERMALNPALRFMVDARSYMGTHPSAYGGNPWRDGTYYTFELPSLVLMYLADPAYFEQAETEISYEADKKRILDPAFWYTSEPSDKDAFKDTKRYYRELDPPVGDRVPDLVQLLHWGIGYFMMHTRTRDNGERINGKQTDYVLHSQTLEQFAFFLYAFPHYQKYFTKAFYERARDLAFRHWEAAGLLGVNKQIGDFKGRECPGHTIAPNLMMYAVAKREGRSDTARYLQAAIAQTQWLIQEVDPSDPVVTKGQRMSEHKLSTGLFFLERLQPGLHIPGLDAWVERLTQIMLERSRNMYDYRRYSAESWTVPKGNVGWNDPGSVAGFPGVAIALSALDKSRSDEAGLQILKASHVDHLFGRNPLDACATRHIADFEGTEIAWPKFDRWDVCARIELIRGALSSVPGHEQFPLNPSGAYRHPEGWTTFNSAFNVSLAYACWQDTHLSAERQGDKIAIRLKAPVDLKDKRRESVPVHIITGEGVTLLELAETDINSLMFEAVTDRKTLGLKVTDEARVAYGYAPFSHEVKLP